MRVGFIADNRLPAFRFGIRSWLVGVPSSSGAGLMRAGWIIDANRDCYEWYRPWRYYDAVVFVKSFSEACRELAESLRAQKILTLFDINVNYYNDTGNNYYEGMGPTLSQQEAAMSMSTSVDGIITASEELYDLCALLNRRVSWLPDHINFKLVPTGRTPTHSMRPLTLWWSGQAVKLFDLLAIEDVLRAYRGHVELRLVTNDRSVMSSWRPGLRDRFDRLLSDVPHTIVPFSSVSDLLQKYARSPGAIISPRFLDSSYNLCHSEWKITLGMACGRVALASPQRSYRAVAELSGGCGIRICSTSEDWCKALDEMLSGRFDWDREETAAEQVVRAHYGTDKVALKHLQLIKSWCSTAIRGNT